MINELSNVTATVRPTKYNQTHKVTKKNAHCKIHSTLLAITNNGTPPTGDAPLLKLLLQCY